MRHEPLVELGHYLVEGSLSNARVLERSGQEPPLPILPEANVIKIGGQSFIDRGRTAVFPLIEEIAEDLGLPTGVLSVLGTYVSMQNARMMNYLLARYGIPFIEPVQFAQLPLYLAERGAVIFFGMPPYTFWHENPDVGRIPPHRTDTGAYLVSEVFGAKSMIFVKDEEGLYTADPKKDRRARFIKTISVAELKDLDLQDVVVERPVLDMMANAKHRRSIRVINGLKKGNLTRALDGDDVGTLIYAD
jgi:molybdenum storage protein